MQMAAGMMGAMNSLNAGMQATAAGNAQAATQLTNEGLAGAFQATADHDQAIAQIRAVLARQSGSSEEFTMIVAEDVLEIEAGKSFLAETAMFYLMSAKNPEPYFRVIESFAEGKPELEETLSSSACQEHTSVSADCLLAIGRAMKDIELVVAKYERRGLPTPPELAQRLWRQ